MRVLIVTIMAFIVVACQGSISMIESDATRKTIDCSRSYVAVTAPGKYTCEQFDAVTAHGGGGGLFQRFNTNGVLDNGTLTNVQIFKVMNRGYIRPGAASFDIQQLNSETKNMTSWSALKEVSGIHVMTAMDADQRRCFGFSYYGKYNNFGAEYQVRGFFCRAANLPLDDAAIAALLGTVTVRDRIESASGS